MSLDRVFLQHCREQDETYAEHARFAFGFGARMMLGGLACMVHGAVPALFTTTGSRTLARLSSRIENRHAAPCEVVGRAASLHAGSMRN